MPTAADILWFKQQFAAEVEPVLVGTPFDLDMMTALACQETGEIWPVLRKRPGLSKERIAALCVGDTLDSDKGRRAFPKTKAELIAAPHGQEMFDLAHKALVDMSAFIASYRPAAKRPNKFVHGFGIWQYDIQFFKEDPQYFLQRRYETIQETLGKALTELKSALRERGFQNRKTLTDFEMATVAIVYNTGSFKPSKGLKQGFFDGSRFYGERVFDLIRLSRTVPKPGAAPAIAPPVAGHAILPPPTPVAATGRVLVVDTKETLLRIREKPLVGKPPTENVLGELPDGHPVRAVSNKKVNGFIEVETSLHGAHFKGFADASLLRNAPKGAEFSVASAEAFHPPVPAVLMPRKPGSITKRTEPAGPHSLNEAGQPARKGETPEDLVAELGKIIRWLAVDKASHKRYQPGRGVTFCNIYVHDYCHLAGVYLPRVWWTPGAIRDLDVGKEVKPLIANTIVEFRANDLFRWLRDFGADFGWRQTGTLDKLQQAANQGAVALIVARRKLEGRSGHIVVIAPETTDERARRNAAGEVVAPLQSQAGAVNFQYGTGRLNWWKGDQFAESAFWIHA